MAPYVRYAAELRNIVQVHLQLGTPPLQIADGLNVSNQWVYALRRIYECFGEVSPPSNSVIGRPRKLHAAAVESLIEFYEDNPQAYLDEAKLYLEEEHDIDVSISTISRQMKKLNLTNKRTERHHPRRSDELREDWQAQISQYQAYQLVFCDESAANERSTERRYGWSPRGFACRVKMAGQHSRRWSLLPAMGLNGYLYHEIHHGSYNTERFNAFVRRLLRYMTPYPGPRSVLVLDNAPIHRSDELKEMCRNADVRVLFLPPYSPDFNAIEESFSGMKAWMRRNRDLVSTFNPFFEGFIQMAVEQAVKAEHARGYFQNVGIRVDEQQIDVGYEEVWEQVEGVN